LREHGCGDAESLIRMSDNFRNAHTDKPIFQQKHESVNVQQGSGNKDRESNGQIYCYFCNRKGHVKANCYKLRDVVGQIKAPNSSNSTWRKPQADNTRGNVNRQVGGDTVKQNIYNRTNFTPRRSVNAVVQEGGEEEEGEEFDRRSVNLIAREKVSVKLNKLIEEIPERKTEVCENRDVIEIKDSFDMVENDEKLDVIKGQFRSGKSVQEVEIMLDSGCSIDCVVSDRLILDKSRLTDFTNIGLANNTNVRVPRLELNVKVADRQFSVKA
jgi:hypothetical protein